MILLHDFAEHLRAATSGPTRGRIDLLLAQAVPFRLSPLAAETMATLAQKPEGLEASRPHMFLPAPITWVEWEDGAGRVGFLMAGQQDSLTHGAGFFVAKPFGQGVIHLGLTIDLADLGRQAIMTAKGGDAWLTAAANETRSGANRIVSIEIPQPSSSMFLATLALLNTPRMVDLRLGADLTKLNRSRVTKGRVPLVSWRDVHINLDQGLEHSGGGNIGEGHMPLHFVRAFLRVRLGKIELVRPHFRGNPEHGVVSKSYRVVRDEDRGDPQE